MTDKKMVLNTSDEAAKFVTGISGWVSRNGRFFGNDERLARYDGCTHVVCDCGNPVEKGWLKCDKCRNDIDNEIFEKLPKQKWDGKTPITLYDGEEYFQDYESLMDYCDNNETTPDKLRLVLCKAIYATEIDPNEYYYDDLPDDSLVADELQKKFNELNNFIRENKIILSWEPTKIAVVIDTYVEKDIIEGGKT